MSIKEVIDKSKPTTAIPAEEEFDIVDGTGGAGKPFAWKSHAFVAVVVVLIAGVSFGIGRLISYDSRRVPISITTDTSVPTTQTATAVLATSTSKADKAALPVSTNPTPVTAPALTSGPIVASKNGTKYYLVTCSGASRINAENKIYFASTDDARKAGLTPSSTCKGLK